MQHGRSTLKGLHTIYNMTCSILLRIIYHDYRCIQFLKVL